MERGTECYMHTEGMMEEDAYIENMCYYAYLSGKLLEKQCFEKGEFAYKYENYGFEYIPFIPSYVPAGQWKIFLKVEDADDECVGCLRANYYV
jgi:hypothetical protein